jgi:hypothetical protein
LRSALLYTRGLLEEVDMRLIALSLALGAAASLASHSALAVESHCTSGNGLRGYNEGYSLEKNLLENIWSRFACNTVEQFVAAIDVPFGASTSSDVYLQCRNVGISTAISDQIYAKQKECLLECYESGSAIGRLNGKIYCGLTEKGEFESSYTLCPLGSQQGCNSALRSYVQTNCPNQVMADPGFDEYVKLACEL